jgi:acetyl esterase/lipase
MADDARAITTEEVVMLYPELGPNPEMPAESAYEWPAAGGASTTMLRNVSQPSLTIFRPDPAKANGVGVIVAPGGGWRILAWDHEGLWVARRLAKLGYTAFVLKYRLRDTPADPAEFAKANAPPADNPWLKAKSSELPRSIAALIPGTRNKAIRDQAADDGRAALALVRARASDWGVDPAKVGMMGFSAGAFLTASVALQPGGAPLAFAAPIYGGETDGLAVPEDAPPLFMAVAGDDRMLVRVCEGLYNAWVDADRPAEIHVFRRGGHGFGLATQNGPVDAWMDLLEAWMKDLGYA